MLRAVNVGGTGKLAMADLRAMAVELGFSTVSTWIASGNLLFRSALPEAEVKHLLEARLADYAGKAVPVFVRSGAEMAAVVAADPFPDAHSSRHLVYFRDTPPHPETLAMARDIKEERIALGLRELYVDYGAGIRDTRLKLPEPTLATGRSMNTVRKLAALLGAMG